jgi:hypothetical protein
MNGAEQSAPDSHPLTAPVHPPERVTGPPELHHSEGRYPIEVIESALLTLGQNTTRITVLALNASRNPEQSVRVRALLSDLLADIQDCEEQLGTYAPLDT